MYSLHHNYTYIYYKRACRRPTYIPFKVITTILITHLQKPFVEKRQTNREQVHKENVSKRRERISQLLESEQLLGHIVTTN